jgi:hypothetical protein
MAIEDADLTFMVSRTVSAVNRVGATNNVHIEFDCGSLNVESFWRLRESGQLIATSEDEKYPEYSRSKDPVAELQRQLLHRSVVSCHINDVEDLFLEFDNGLHLEVFCDSTMFESWQLDGGPKKFYVGRGW